jgi:hypothetical protein
MVKNNSVRHWLSAQRMQLQTSLQKKETPPTHTCLDGGVFHVPNDRMFEFHEVYAKAFDKGESLTFVEIKGDVFKFFVDIDLKDTREYTESELLSIAKVSCDTVASVVELGDVNNVFVCASRSVRLDATTVKTGLHMVWENVIVDVVRAEMTAQQIVMDLQDALGPRLSPQNAWDDVVDSSVYRSAKSPGLRMRGSIKPREETPRYYWPRWLLNKAMEPQPLPSTLDIISRSSLWVASGTNFTRVFMEKIHQCIHDKSEREQLREKHKGSNFVDCESESLVRWMCTQFPDHRLTPSKIRRVGVNRNAAEKPTTYVVYVDCRYCMNKGAEHSSNNVYFVVGPSGVKQKCFSKKNVTRGRGVCCGKFESGVTQLPPHLKRELFPGASKRGTAIVSAAGGKGKRKRASSAEGEQQPMHRSFSCMIGVGRTRDDGDEDFLMHGNY